jgi:hypothetical protein
MDVEAATAAAMEAAIVPTTVFPEVEVQHDDNYRPIVCRVSNIILHIHTYIYIDIYIYIYVNICECIHTFSGVYLHRRSDFIIKREIRHGCCFCCYRFRFVFICT